MSDYRYEPKYETVAEPESKNHHEKNWIKRPKRVGGTIGYCYGCHRKKNVVADLDVNGEKFPICVSCLNNREQTKVRKCLKCDRDFVSFDGMRLCFRCKGQTKRDKVLPKYAEIQKQLS